MKAIKVEVAEREWSLVSPFVEYINDDDVVAYQTSRTGFLVVAEGECAMARVNALITSRFDEETLITDIRK